LYIIDDNYVPRMFVPILTTAKSIKDEKSPKDHKLYSNLLLA